VDEPDQNNPSVSKYVKFRPAKSEVQMDNASETAVVTAE